MSAVAVQTGLCVCGSDHLCACGCGEEIHPLVRRVHELAARGVRPTVIGRMLEIDHAQVYAYRVKPPTFLKGHAARALKRAGTPCANPNCERTFTKMGPNHLYCTYADRHEHDDERDECARLAAEHKRRLLEEQDTEIARRAVTRMAASEKRSASIISATLAEVVAIADDPETVAIYARQRFREIKWSPPQLKYAQPILDRMVAEHRREADSTFDAFVRDLTESVRWRSKARRKQSDIVRQAIDRSPELAELIAEQERDARWGDRMPKWVLSLQRKVGDDGTTMGDLLPSPDSDDPYQTMLGQLLRECLAGRDLDDIDALDDWTREWLQHKLSEHGFAEAPLVMPGDKKIWLPHERQVRSVSRPTRWDAEATLGGRDAQDEYEAGENIIEVASVHAKANKDIRQRERSAHHDIREFRLREKAARRASKREQRRLNKVAAMRER